MRRGPRRRAAATLVRAVPMAADSDARAASRAGNRNIRECGGPARRMETFKKRQQETQRLEKQRYKAEKRKELKVRKAAGIASDPDESAEITAEVLPAPTETVPLTK